MYRDLWKECLRAKSLYRALHNASLNGLTLRGRTIDLGSKNGTSSYYRFIKAEDITFVDYYEGGENVVRLDLEKELPIDSEAFDNVIMFNTLEHIQNHDQLIAESLRILRPGGGCSVLCHFYIPTMQIPVTTSDTHMRHLQTC